MVEKTVKRFDPGGELRIPEGCHINELSNDADDPDVSIARARIEAGVTTRWHRLRGITERYVIQQGEGLVEVDDLAETVSAGDVVVIPPLSRQRITNTGAGDLVFLAVCTPRFTDSAYEDAPDP